MSVKQKYIKNYRLHGSITNVSCFKFITKSFIQAGPHSLPAVVLDFPAVSPNSSHCSDLPLLPLTLTLFDSGAKKAWAYPVLWFPYPWCQSLISTLNCWKGESEDFCSGSLIFMQHFFFPFLSAAVGMWLFFMGRFEVCLECMSRNVQHLIFVLL